MSIARRLAFCALLAVALAAPAPGAEWADRFSFWNQANEGRALGADNSASLAWWESYVLQAYLRMYSATGDSLWLNRFCVHADTMLAVARDVPDSGTYWPGYRDGFLGWGTDHYDPGHQYQEYMVHDGMACLPLARFSRMVLSDSQLRKRYGVRAGRYVDFIEANVVAKWCANWHADRGTGEDLSPFGGWQNLPFNQSLVFGELLLVLYRAGEIRGLLRRGLSQEISQTRTSGFYSEVPDSMARVLKSCLLYNVDRDAYIWRYQEPNSYWEDISHANLDLSFALEAHADGVVFSDTDLTRFAGTLEQVMWNRSVAEPQFTRYVNGSGAPDSTGNLEAWLLLGDFRAQAYWLIMTATQVLCNSTPPQSLNAGQALVLATLAEMQPRFPDNIDPHLAVEESAGTVPEWGLSPVSDVRGAQPVCRTGLNQLSPSAPCPGIPPRVRLLRPARAHAGRAGTGTGPAPRRMARRRRQRQSPSGRHVPGDSLRRPPSSLPPPHPPPLTRLSPRAPRFPPLANRQSEIANRKFLVSLEVCLGVCLNVY